MLLNTIMGEGWAMRFIVKFEDVKLWCALELTCGIDMFDLLKLWEVVIALYALKLHEDDLIGCFEDWELNLKLNKIQNVG